MASTKTTQSEITADAARTRAEKSAARNGRKNAQKAARANGDTESKKPERQVSEELLHALFRRCKDVQSMYASDHRPTTPMPLYICRSHEFTNASRTHGLLAAILRMRKAFGDQDFVPPVDFLVVVTRGDGSAYEAKLLPPKEAVTVATEKEEAGTLYRLELPFSMHYVLTEWDASGKESERMCYISGGDIERTRSAVHNAMARNQRPGYGYRIEAFTTKHFADLHMSVRKDDVKDKESWFPIEIEITAHGHPEYGQKKVIEWGEIPNGVPFRVLRTRVKKA
jgi:hypothetical protein